MVSWVRASAPAGGRRSPGGGRRVGDALVAAAFAVLLVLPPVSGVFVIPLAVVAATCGWSSRGAWSGGLALLAAAVVGAMAPVVSAVSLQGVLVVAALDVCFGVLPWLVAVAWRARRASTEAAAAAAEQRERVRRHEAEAALARERMLLAEELHDDLGHALSLVALNLGRLELEPRIEEPSRDAIAASRRQVAEAVARLGASVEVLRSGEQAALVSRHRQVDLDGLVADARAAGALIEVVGRPSADRVAEFGAATVFRVVQEGVTNAVKHAPGQPVTLRFDDAGNRLRITVTNDVPAGRGSDRSGGGGGYGLVALGERVRLAGGTVETSDGDGFTLSVVLPREGTVTADRPVSVGQAPNEVVRARRRSTALIWAAALVPVVAVGCIAVAVQLLTLQRAREAELEPEVFAQIAPGDARAGVEPLLPGGQLDIDDDPPAGGDCSYYAVTSNPLDDASGDYYRICFDGDVVASADLISAGHR
ncbi:ATP-binding protein [Polymorphospora sp. NPDC050346]|uniref:sensor histidine kinase n=1 Tax=Polymorphospora sp. NPDC050346 TaxID=3155780 RepID=UPI0033EB8D60